MLEELQPNLCDTSFCVSANGMTVPQTAFPKHDQCDSTQSVSAQAQKGISNNLKGWKSVNHLGTV